MPGTPRSMDAGLRDAALRQRCGGPKADKGTSGNHLVNEGGRVLLCLWERF